MTDKQRQTMIAALLRWSDIMEGTGLSEQEKGQLPSLSDEELKTLHHYLGYEVYLYEKMQVEEEELEEEWRHRHELQ